MYPIVILWAHPRSMSTAIERIMRERGDFDCLHEPFLHYYYLHRGGRALPHFEADPDHPVDYSETRELLLKRAEHGPVFAKDMSYYVIPELLEDGAFCRRVRHCFLIRNPARSIVSYFRLDPTLTLDEVGLEAQWRHFTGLRELGLGEAPVLEAEAVRADGETTMRAFWSALDIDYVDHAFTWRRDSTPEDWHYVRGWHDAVTGSSGIHKLDAREAGLARAEFDEACRQAPHLRAYLEHHLPFYDNLRAYSLTRHGRGTD